MRRGGELVGRRRLQRVGVQILRGMSGRTRCGRGNPTERTGRARSHALAHGWKLVTREEGRNGRIQGHEELPATIRALTQVAR